MKPISLTVYTPSWNSIKNSFIAFILLRSFGVMWEMLLRTLEETNWNEWKYEPVD